MIYKRNGERFWPDRQIRIGDINYPPNAIFAWRDKWAEWGITEENDPPPPEPTPEEIAAAAQAAQDALDLAEAKAHAKLAALRDMTPAQVKAWVDTNVTNFAQAQDAIKTLAIAVSVLMRRA